jgi:pimeloyl-ACP methyl ester carboxylesterase
MPGILRGRHSAAALSVPTRIVFGQRDGVITTRAVKDAAAQSEQIELELVADADHFVVDARPELVADRLLALLSG